MLTAAGVYDGDVLLPQGLVLREGPPDGARGPLSGTLQLGDCAACNTDRLASVSAVSPKHVYLTFPNHMRSLTQLGPI